MRFYLSALMMSTFTCKAWDLNGIATNFKINLCTSTKVIDPPILDCFVTNICLFVRTNDQNGTSFAFT